MEFYSDVIYPILNFLSVVLVGALALLALGVLALFVLDITQHKDAVRRNYPVLGRFRYLFSKLGEFFRQYFFAMDREEMPFNRAEREWVDNSSRGEDNTVAFGSTKNLTVPGTAIFVNCPFPTLDEDAEITPPVTIGPYCPEPYETSSIINISGMSYGALSQPAVRALSAGAKMAGCWMNTGEGGLSPYHLEGGCDLVFQIGTAKYGARNDLGGLDEAKLQKIAAHQQVRMFEIKMSQGAKAGKGGILPAAKVTPEIASIRGIEAGKDSIPPNRHPEINNAEQLLDFVHRVREVTGKPTGFKTVIGGYGPQAGRKVFTLQTLPACDESFNDQVGKVAGFSLHAGVVARADERKKLERLCRYISRPAVSEKRLSLTADGNIRYQLKTPYRDGTTHVIFEPLDFIARLAALVPKPRVNLTRFHGVFAPNSKHRARVTPAKRGKGSKPNACAGGEEKTPSERRASMRLKRSA